MKDNGGYVYPRKLPNTAVPPHEVIKFLDRYSGKTLLDDFAGQAMQSLIEYFIEKESLLSFKDMSEMAYNAAEAMVKEKRKREE